MHDVFLGLGSNLGNKEENLNKALVKLAEKIGEIIKCSSFYVSEPWGYQSENTFLNSVVHLKTKLLPEEVLSRINEIEKILGRTAKSSSGYADRIIDIDILLFDDLILEADNLKIPHPHIAERNFVLIPLVEIAPDIKNPVSREYFSAFIK